MQPQEMRQAINEIAFITPELVHDFNAAYQSGDSAIWLALYHRAALAAYHARFHNEAAREAAQAVQHAAEYFGVQRPGREVFQFSAYGMEWPWHKPDAAVALGYAGRALSYAGRKNRAPDYDAMNNFFARYGV